MHSFFHLGDSALLIEFGNTIDEATHNNVMKAYRCLKGAALPFVRDLVPSYASLTVAYDMSKVQKGITDDTLFDAVTAAVQQVLAANASDTAPAGRTVQIPVCYAPAFAADLESLARSAELSPEEVIRLHTAPTYRVYAIGFLPGFAYMGTVDPRIAKGRKERPAPRIAAGSVGIAGAQTGIYPIDSPGGWNIIGRTPLQMFDPSSENPALLSPGDTITFYPISEDEFAHYQSRLA